MDGYIITFYTQRNRDHEGVPLADWIIEQAQKIGVRGATLFTGKEGFGHDGRFHSESYFAFEDSPQLITMALTIEECNTLISRIKSENLKIFYSKSKAEFGFTSDT